MKIKKGTHAPFRFPKLICNPETLRYLVTFTESCRYDIGEDQDDINKLFGVGYFPFHHINSVRVGWRYKNGKIEILAYWYKNKVRGWEYLCSVDIGCEIDLSIKYAINHHYIYSPEQINYRVDVPGQRIGYLLRPYFGGNKTAPHDIEILGI